MVPAVSVALMGNPITWSYGLRRIGEAPVEAGTLVGALFLLCH
jgi:hypothetical protein